MKSIRISAALALLATGAMNAHAQTPAHLWSEQFTGGGLQAVTAMAARTSRLWVSGGFTGTVNLGGATYSTPDDDFIAMFDYDGVYQWSHAYGSGGDCNTMALGVDTSDNLYTTGQFSGTVDFGGGILTSAGSTDIFLAKFNVSGVHQWSKRFGGTGINENGLALTIDASNNVIIGGHFTSSADFGGGLLTSAGGNDAFIAKFNSAGTHQWSKKFGDATDQQVDNLSATTGNDVYATGKFFGTVNFGGSNLVSAGQTDAFLVKYNSAGTHQWSQRFGNTLFDYGVDVEADVSNVTLLANYNVSINFGGATLTSAGGQDIAVARLSNAGVHAWSKSFGDASSQVGTGLDGGSGSLFVAGYFNGTINFGDHPLVAVSASQDAFLARLVATDGNDVWSQRFGSNGTDFAIDMQSIGTRTYLAGYFDDEIDFGHGDPLVSPFRDNEAFVAAFGLNAAEPLIGLIKDLPKDQGGVVTVSFQRSEYDLSLSPVVIRGYEVYLRQDPLPFASGASRTQAADAWVLVGEAPAHGLFSNVTLATTEADSTVSEGMHTSVFKVRAITDDPSVIFDSPPLGGYSLDNLAPGLPQNLVIENDVLSWQSSADGDIAYYSVYGSEGAFDENAVLIDYAPATHLDLAGRAFSNYFVTATDRSGNEGRAASLTGSARASRTVPGTLSVSAFPNPFNPETTIRYTLPTAGAVRIEVFDAAGAFVRRLVDDDQPAGAFTARWDGRNAAGVGVGSGVYFARVQHDGASRAYKMVMLK